MYVLEVYSTKGNWIKAETLFCQTQINLLIIFFVFAVFYCSWSVFVLFSFVSLSNLLCSVLPDACSGVSVFWPTSCWQESLHLWAKTSRRRFSTSPSSTWATARRSCSSWTRLRCPSSRRCSASGHSQSKSHLYCLQWILKPLAIKCVSIGNGVQNMNLLMMHFVWFHCYMFVFVLSLFTVALF